MFVLPAKSIEVTNLRSSGLESHCFIVKSTFVQQETNIPQCEINILQWEIRILPLKTDRDEQLDVVHTQQSVLEVERFSGGVQCVRHLRHVVRRRVDLEDSREAGVVAIARDPLINEADRSCADAAAGQVQDFCVGWMQDEVAHEVLKLHRVNVRLGQFALRVEVANETGIAAKRQRCDRFRNAFLREPGSEHSQIGVPEPPVITHTHTRNLSEISRGIRCGVGLCVCMLPAQDEIWQHMQRISLGLALRKMSFTSGIERDLH